MRLALLVVAGICALAPVAARAQGGAGTDTAPIRTTPFPDVPRDHWAYDAVEQMRKMGILRGYPPTPAPKKRPAAAKKPAAVKPRRA